jgi:lipoprotein-anchoring transpeptidase ErfK/SrfK
VTILSKCKQIRAAFLPLGLFFLAACSTSSETGPSLEQLKLAYANEPYEVRIVNREKFDTRFRPTIVPAPKGMPAGSILVDTRERFLYLVEEGGKARRYGVAVGASGHAWSGTATIGRKAKWPAWHPTDDMRNETPGLPQRIEPGPHNPLGARALYLYQDGRDTLYRIHGTSEPWTIGTEASSGCIRMLNEDVIDLYDRVAGGAMVRVI